MTSEVGMAKSCALLLSVALLAAPAGRAESVVVRADWQKARAMLTQGEYRPRIAIELKSPKRVTLTQNRGEFHPRSRKEVELKPSKWVKGKFIEATDAGVQLVFREHEISFMRGEVNKIRLVPLKADRKKKRWHYMWAGIPVGFAAGLLVSLMPCRGDLNECSAGGVLFITGITMVATTFGFYKLGRRAGRVDVIVVLDDSAASKPPATSQAERTSPVK